MAVNFELHRVDSSGEWKATGRVVKMPEPSDLRREGQDPKLKTREQLHAENALKKMNESKKWVRTQKAPALGKRPPKSSK